MERKRLLKSIKKVEHKVDFAKPRISRAINEVKYYGFP